MFDLLPTVECWTKKSYLQIFHCGGQLQSGPDEHLNCFRHDTWRWWRIHVYCQQPVRLVLAASPALSLRWGQNISEMRVQNIIWQIRYQFTLQPWPLYSKQKQAMETNYSKLDKMTGAFLYWCCYIFSWQKRLPFRQSVFIHICQKMHFSRFMNFSSLHNQFADVGKYFFSDVNINRDKTR